MRIQDFGEEQARLARCFVAWWLTSHHFGVETEEAGMTADEMWPLDHGAGEHDEADPLAFENEEFNHMLTLLPEADRPYWTELRAEASRGGPSGP